MSSIAHLQDLREAAFAQAQQQELLLSEFPDNVFYRLTYQQAQERSQSLTAEIIQRQRQREQEIIEVRLIGRTATHGTLPLDTLSVVSGTFADTIHEVSKYTTAGRSTRRNLMAEVKSRLDLRLASVAPGSTRLFVSGQTSPDLFGNSLLSTSLDHTFDLLAAEDPDAVMEQVPAVGHSGVIALQRFLRGIHRSHLEVELKWDTPAHAFRTWSGTTNRLVSLSSLLGQVAEEAPVSFSFTGTVITLSLKGSLEVRDDLQGPIIARYLDALLPAIQTLHVGQACEGTMVKTTLVQTTTGARKSSFTLTSITARPA